jgi:hypothetical protein
MNNRIIILLLIAWPGVFFSWANAAPTAFYDRSSGNIYLQNDLPQYLVAVTIGSASGRLSGEPIMRPFPPTVDATDAPFFISVLTVLPTETYSGSNLDALINLGEIVPDHEAAGDLTFRYWPNHHFDFLGQVITVPEQMGATSILLAVLVIGRMRRRSSTGIA